MIFVATILLLMAVLAFVGYPLLKTAPAGDTGKEGMPTKGTRTSPVAEQRERLLVERDHALAALKDLEFEHSLSNVSDHDFEELRSAQRHKAVAILRELDQIPATSEPAPAGDDDLLDGHAALDARLEEQIATARRRLSSQGEEDGDEHRRCDACDASLPRDAGFCSACGQPVQETGACPACGTSRRPRDRYCPGCGRLFEQKTGEMGDA